MKFKYFQILIKREIDSNTRESLCAANYCACAIFLMVRPYKRRKTPFARLPVAESRLVDQWMDTYGLSANIPEFQLLTQTSTLCKTQIYNYMSTRRKREMTKRHKRGNRVTFRTPIADYEKSTGPPLDLTQNDAEKLDGYQFNFIPGVGVVAGYRFALLPDVLLQNPWDVFDNKRRLALQAQRV